MLAPAMSNPCHVSPAVSQRPPLSKRAQRAEFSGLYVAALVAAIVISCTGAARPHVQNDAGSDSLAAGKDNRRQRFQGVDRLTTSGATLLGRQRKPKEHRQGDLHHGEHGHRNPFGIHYKNKGDSDLDQEQANHVEVPPKERNQRHSASTPTHGRYDDQTENHVLAEASGYGAPSRHTDVVVEELGGGPVYEQVMNPNASFENRRVLDGDQVPYYPGLSQVSNIPQLLYALGGGTGANVGGTGSLKIDIDLIRRMRYQDEAVMILLVVVYFLTLLFSACYAYRQVANNSHITYFADPRYHALAVDRRSIEPFLEEFNQSPKELGLQVTGFMRSTTDDDLPVPNHAIEWHNHLYSIAFTFSLDLSSWITKDTSQNPSEPGDAEMAIDEEGVVIQDKESLNSFLENNTNDLATIEMIKYVSWKNWEELATNIKHRIRQTGFPGVIVVNRPDFEKVVIYKNRQWANFMHSRTLKVLCALSIIGWIVYVPYMWLRCRNLVVRSFHRVDITINDYWELFLDHLQEYGTQEPLNELPEDLQSLTSNRLAAAARRVPDERHRSDASEHAVAARSAADERRGFDTSVYNRN